MKKSVILILITVYVLALVLVGSIGANMVVYEEKVYIEKVNIASVKMEQADMTIKTNPETGERYCVAKTSIADREKGIAFTMECSVLPADATNGKIEVQISPSQKDKVKNLSVNGTTVTFELASHEPVAIEITVKPEDSNLNSAKDTITIYLEDKPII